MKNLDIRCAVGGAGLKLWQLAEELGMSDSSLSRKLRKELSDGDKEKMYLAIERLSGGRS